MNIGFKYSSYIVIKYIHSVIDSRLGGYEKDPTGYNRQRSYERHSTWGFVSASYYYIILLCHTVISSFGTSNVCVVFT